MKLYNSIGPNPRLVNMVCAEKGVVLARVEVDIMAGENRRPAFLALNPTGTTPVLQLDDGSCIAETVAICEYLEELFPQVALIGRTAVERARTRMWWRRVDLQVVQPMIAGFRGAEGLPLFRDRVRCLPQAAADLKLMAQEGMAWLDGQLGEQPFLCGEALTIADLQLFCFIEFGDKVGQSPDPRLQNLARWRERMAARPAARVAWL